MSLDELWERWGKILFSQLRPPFLFALLLFPLGIAIGILFFQHTALKEWDELFEESCRKGRKALLQKRERERFIERYGDPSPHFLSQQLESLPLLQKEREELLFFLSHPAMKEEEKGRGKISWLEPEKNHLSFVEESVQITHHVQERTQKLRHPVLVNGEDLKTLIAKIEDSEKGEGPRPQLLFEEFKLHKKILPSTSEEVFEVDCTLIQREFVKP